MLPMEEPKQRSSLGLQAFLDPTTSFQALLEQKNRDNQPQADQSGVEGLAKFAQDSSTDQSSVSDFGEHLVGGFVRQLSDESVYGFADTTQQDFDESAEETKDQSLPEESSPLRGFRPKFENRKGKRDAGSSTASSSNKYQSSPRQVMNSPREGGEQAMLAQKGAQALMQIANQGVEGLAQLTGQEPSPDQSSTTDFDDDLDDGFVRQSSFQSGAFRRQVSDASIQAFTESPQKDAGAGMEEAKGQRSLFKNTPPMQTSCQKGKIGKSKGEVDTQASMHLVSTGCGPSDHSSVGTDFDDDFDDGFVRQSSFRSGAFMRQVSEHSVQSIDQFVHALQQGIRASTEQGRDFRPKGKGRNSKGDGASSSGFIDPATPSLLTFDTSADCPEQSSLAQKGAQALVQLANRGVQGLAKLTHDGPTTQLSNTDHSSNTDFDDDFDGDGFVRQLSFGTGGFVRQTSLALSDCFARQVSAADSVQAFGDAITKDFRTSAEEAKALDQADQNVPQANRPKDLDLCAKLVQQSVHTCTQLVKDGVLACERLEAKALQDQRNILSAAFDATLVVNVAQDGLIVDCNEAAEGLFGMAVKGKSLSDMVIEQSHKDLERLMVSGMDSSSGAVGRVLVTAEDADDMQFDCEVKIVNPLSDKSSDLLFLGVNLVGEKRAAMDTVSEQGTSNDTEFTLAFTQTDDGYAMESGTQTIVENSTICVQTDVSVDTSAVLDDPNGWPLNRRRPPRLPSVEGAPDVRGVGCGPSPRRGMSPRSRSHRHSPNVKPPSSTLTPTLPDQQTSNRAQSEPPRSQQISSSSTRRGTQMGSLNGEWIAVSANGGDTNSISDLNAWLARLTILGDTVILGDGTMAKLGRRRDGFFLLYGGLLVLDGDHLHRDGKSGNRVTFARCEEKQHSEISADDDAASFVE